MIRERAPRGRNTGVPAAHRRVPREIPGMLQALHRGHHMGPDLRGDGGTCAEALDAMGGEHNRDDPTLLVGAVVQAASPPLRLVQDRLGVVGEKRARRLAIAYGRELAWPTAAVWTRPSAPFHGVIIEPGSTSAAFPTEGRYAPTQHPCYRPQAHALVQAYLQPVPLRVTQLTVLLSHPSPSALFDLRLSTSFLSGPLPFQSLAAIMPSMDMQETIDSLRTVLESVIAPGVKDLRTRLDGVEKSVDRLDGRVEHLAERMEEGFIRSDARMDRLAERMESGFARMDARLDEGFARADARTDNVSTRMEEGFARMDTRLDALMTAITSTRIYPDTLSARLDRLEREVQELRKA
jgi:hypothetical protein